MGAKRLETRSWPPPDDLIGQQLAIHAGKTVIEFPDTDYYAPFNQAVERVLGPGWSQGVPVGKVVAVATLTDAVCIFSAADFPDGDEALFGEYEPGRWIWRLDDVKLLRPPLPARGRQRLWYWTPPDDVA